MYYCNNPFIYWNSVGGLGVLSLWGDIRGDSMKIDPVAVKQWLLFGYPFSGNLSSNKLEYKRIKYNYDGRSIEQTVKELDEVFTDIMFETKERYSDDTVFGLGLSGGLDSRLVLHYALKADMKVVLYTFGFHRPHTFLLSRDHKNAIDIAKHFRIDPPKFIEFQNKPVEGKFNEVCRKQLFGSYAPMQFHIRDEDLPEFDVKLGGYDGGEWLGGNVPPNIYSLDYVEQVGCIFHLTPLSHRSGIKYEQDMWVDGLVSPGEYHIIWNQLLDFVSGFDKQIEAFQSFLVGFLTPHRGDGDAGECMYRHRRFLKEALSWNPRWMVDRRIQKHFFNQIHPKLAQIPTQSRRVPLGVNENIVNKCRYLVEYGLRGYALRYHDIYTSIEFRRYANKVFSTPNEVFDDLFDTRRIMNLPKYQSPLMARCMRIKRELDLICGEVE